MTSPATDEVAHMRRALELASRGWGRVAPNPLVGAVIVKEGRVVGEGWHREYGLPHAEVEAIRAAGPLATGATLYVTLEPCSHHGKTPPCTDAIIAAGIRRVVFAAGDVDPTARGGAEILRERGIEVAGGVEEAAARALNAPFFRTFAGAAPRLPFTELKLALSLDGRIADPGGRSRWITGSEAREEVHRIRAGADAIAVGVGTAILDDPSLTVRGPVSPRIPPIRVVFDRRLRLPPDGTLARSAAEIPVWLVAAPDAPPEQRQRLEALGVRVLEADSLQTGLAALAGEGVRSLLCEGGAEIASALLRDELVDRLTLVFAPLILGSNGSNPFAGVPDSPLDSAPRWRLLRSVRLGDDVLISLER